MTRIAKTTTASRRIIERLKRARAQRRAAYRQPTPSDVSAQIIHALKARMPHA